MRFAAQFVLLELLLVPVAGSAQGQGLSVDHALDAYESSLSSLDTLAYAGVTQYRNAYDSHTATTAMDFHKDGRRWRFRERETGVRGGRQYASDLEILLLDQDRYLWIGARQSTQGRRFNMRATLFDESVATKRNQFRTAVAPFVYGNLMYDNQLTLPNVLRSANAELRSATVPVGGHNTVVVESFGRYGHHVVCLDPQAGFLPRKAQVVKRGRDVLGNQPVVSIRSRFRDSKLGGYPQMKQGVVLVDNVRIQEVERNCFVITGYSVTRAFLYENGDEEIANYQVTIDSIELNPDSETYGVTMEIPEGNDVLVLNDRTISCEWRNADIRRVVDGRVVERHDIQQSD